MKPRDKEILNIAIPSIISNITVPLLGMVDVAIMGHLGNAAYIGARSRSEERRVGKECRSRWSPYH